MHMALGFRRAPVLDTMYSMMSRRIKNNDKPRTPPPSRERILGIWCADVSSISSLCCQSLVYGKSSLCNVILIAAKNADAFIFRITYLLFALHMVPFHTAKH